MQMIYRSALAVALVALSASSSFAAPGELKLTISNGLVTIVADQVPVSRILSEWARVGQTRIVNGEKLFTMVSLEVVDWPEKKALDLILRTASGYMAAERQNAAAGGASAFDRIMILPFSKGPVNTMPAASTPAPFAPRPMPQQDTVDDDQNVVQQPMPAQQPQTQSMPGMPPPPQNVPGQPQPVPNPNAPTTLPRPGMLPQPGPQQPVPFGTPPGVPPKPPGGGGGGGSQLS